MWDEAFQRHRVPIEAEAMRTVRRRVEAFAAARGFSEEKVRDLSLAVAEALFNAMDHGGCSEQVIELEITYRRNRIQVAVEDPGGGEAEADRRCHELQRYLSGEDSTVLPGMDQERGRGLYLIRAKSDEVWVERAQGGGVRIVMVKRR